MERDGVIRSLGAEGPCTALEPGDTRVQRVDRFEVFAEFVPVGGAELLTQGVRFCANQVQHRAAPRISRAAAPTHEALEDRARRQLARCGLCRRAPGDVRPVDSAVTHVDPVHRGLDPEDEGVDGCRAPYPLREGLVERRADLQVAAAGAPHRGAGEKRRQLDVVAFAGATLAVEEIAEHAAAMAHRPQRRQGRRELFPARSPGPRQHPVGHIEANKPQGPRVRAAQWRHRFQPRQCEQRTAAAQKRPPIEWSTVGGAGRDEAHG